jgi:hypothetical protein
MRYRVTMHFELAPEAVQSYYRAPSRNSVVKRFTMTRKHWAGVCLILVLMGVLSLSCARQQGPVPFFRPGLHPMGPDCSIFHPGDVCSVSYKFVHDSGSSSSHMHGRPIYVSPKKMDGVQITHDRPFTVSFEFLSQEPTATCKDGQGNTLPPFTAVKFPYTTSGSIFNSGPADKDRDGCTYKATADDHTTGAMDPHIYVGDH